MTAAAIGARGWARTVKARDVAMPRNAPERKPRISRSFTGRAALTSAASSASATRSAGRTKSRGSVGMAAEDAGATARTCAGAGTASGVSRPFMVAAGSLPLGPFGPAGWKPDASSRRCRRAFSTELPGSVGAL